MVSTVILALWPNATAAATERLIMQHQLRNPDARIEVLRCHDMKKLEDADYTRPRGKVLLHIFGHEATVQVCSLLRMYYAATGKALDVETIIFDTPPPNSWATTIRSGRVLWNACVWALSWASWIVDEPPYDKDTWIRQDLQNSRLLPQSTKLHHARKGERRFFDTGREEAGMGIQIMPRQPASRCFRRDDTICC